jgi:hypothetical protein
MENAIEHRSRAPVAYANFTHENSRRKPSQGHFLDASELPLWSFSFVSLGPTCTATIERTCNRHDADLVAAPVYETSLLGPASEMPLLALYKT